MSSRLRNGSKRVAQLDELILTPFITIPFFLEFNMNALTQGELKSIIYYNKKTGLLYRKKNGKRAGGISVHGYEKIKINGTVYASHRLAWMYEYGYFPELYIDHIDRCKTNNRIENLREVSCLCNARNSKTPKNNNSGVKGVFICKTRNKWRATIKLNNVTRHLYIGDDFIEAVCHRLSAEQCLDWMDCDKTSSSFLYIKNIYFGDTGNETSTFCNE